MNERRLIVTMAVGDKSRRFSEITFPLIQKYAQKCGADFFTSYQLNPKHSYIGCQRLDFLPFLEQYDRILYIDADMIVRSNTPNLFDMMGDYHFAAVDEGKYQSPIYENRCFVDRYKDVQKTLRFKPFFYVNIGLYMFDKDAILAFKELYNNEMYHFREQSKINDNLHWIPEILLLPPQFNYMSLMEFAGLPKEEAYIIHYAGNWGGHSDDQIIEMMKRDYF